jgi:hypothetical protein
MSAAIVAALKASLDNPANEWVCTGVSPMTDDNGHGTITYQMQSVPLGVSFVAMREVGGAEDVTRLFVGSFAYSTSDGALLSKIAAKAATAAAAFEADLIARL